MLIEFSIEKKIFIYFPLFILISYIRETFIIEYDFGVNDNLIYDFPRIFMIIFYIFEKKLSKRKIKYVDPQLLFKDQNEVYIETHRKKKENIKKIILIVCLILFNMIFDYLSLLYKELTKYNLDFLILFLINNIFFEKNIYSHQFLSIMINIFALIYGFYKEIYLSKSFLFYQISSSYTECFSYLLIKYINMQYYINIYLLGSLEGIGLLIRYIIKQIIDGENFIEINDIPIYIYAFSFLVLSSYFFLKYKVIFELNSFYFFIMDNFSYFLITIIQNYEYLDLIKFSVVFLSSLIYCEIIQLNFCSLSDNTKKKIMERGENDFNSTISTINCKSNIIEDEIDLFDFKIIV